MAHDEDACSVDFVVGDDPIALPSEPGAVLPDRWRRAVVALVVAALIVTAVLWRPAGAKHRSPIVAGTSAVRTSAAPSVMSHESWQLRSTALIAVPSADEVVVDARTGTVIRCPTFQACTLTSHLPRAVLQAIRAAFPTAQVLSASSALFRRDNTRSAYLAQRIVVARAGATTITVELHSPGPVSVSASTTAGRLVMRTAGDGRSLTVESSVAGRKPLPSYDRLERLVADPRLLSQ